MAALISIISALFSVAGKIFDWLYAQRLVDAGKTAEKLSELKGQVDAAHKAVEARLAIERDERTKPDGVRDDDEFRRPE